VKRARKLFVQSRRHGDIPGSANGDTGVIRGSRPNSDRVRVENPFLKERARAVLVRAACCNEAAVISVVARICAVLCAITFAWKRICVLVQLRAQWRYAKSLHVLFFAAVRCFAMRRRASATLGLTRWRSGVRVSTSLQDYSERCSRCPRNPVVIVFVRARHRICSPYASS